MQWVNIDVAFLHSEAFSDAPESEQSVWLKLLGYCCEQENGGIIAGAGSWDDRKWIRLCNATRRAVLTCTTLVTVKGNDIHVMNYPLAQQKAVQAKRTGGRKGNAKRWELGDGSESHSDQVSESVMEGKGREGKEREPPNPQGGLSEAEARFAPLLKTLQTSGKIAQSTTAATLAVYWRNNAITRVDPEDPDFILHVATMLQGHVGRVGSLSPWLAARAEEFKKSQKTRAPALVMGPSGGDM